MAPSTGAVSLQASFQLWPFSQKNVTVGDGYRPVIIAEMNAAGLRPRSSPSVRDKRDLQILLLHLGKGDLRLWPAQYRTMAVRSC